MDVAPDFYARPSLNVETYDRRAEQDIAGTDAEGDVEFYLDLASRVGGPVLDVGGGTGRVAWPLAVAGHHVVSVDRSESMLAAAEAKRASMPVEAGQRVRFVRADMADFSLPDSSRPDSSRADSFRLAITPFRSFQALLAPEQQRGALASIHRHLAPGGLLVLDLFDPRVEWLSPGDVATPRPERPSVRHPVTGNEVHIRVLSRANDAFHQVLEERWEFSESNAEGHVVRREEETLRLRWTYRWETRYLLELTGFEVEAEYSDFRGSPPAYGREQVWVARRV